jgi:hypothetical protein
MGEGEEMRTMIEMAHEVYGEHTFWTEAQLLRLKAFADLVRADEREQYKWGVHSCGPTCKRYACVAMREAIEAERDAIISRLLEIGALEDGVFIESIRARGNS